MKILLKVMIDNGIQTPYPIHAHSVDFFPRDTDYPYAEVVTTDIKSPTQIFKTSDIKSICMEILMD